MCILYKKEIIPQNLRIYHLDHYLSPHKIAFSFSASGNVHIYVLISAIYNEFYFLPFFFLFSL